MEEQIERIRESTNIGNLDNICIFNFNDSVDFISWVLTTISGETYNGISMKFSNDELNIPLYMLTEFPSYDTEEENKCLIASSRINEQVWQLYERGRITGSSELTRAMGEEKYILLDQKENLVLYDWRNEKVPEEITRAFPCLEPIILDLISLRSSNPGMSQVHLFNMILEKLKSKYPNNEANRK